MLVEFLKFLTENYFYSPQGGDPTTGSATWDANVLSTVYPQTGQVPTQDVALMADFEDLVELVLW